MTIPDGQEAATPLPRTEPTAEDLASRDDLLLAYDRLSRGPETTTRQCYAEPGCVVDLATGEHSL